jgi:multiple antibiotic resistance protein
MRFFWEVFVTLFVIIDPAGIVPVFLGLTRGRSRQDRNQLAGQATIVAFGVIVVFALFGRTILDYLGVGLPALEGAGGVLLLLVALELLTGKAAEPTEAKSTARTWPSYRSAPRCWPARRDRGHHAVRPANPRRG